MILQSKRKVILLSISAAILIAAVFFFFWWRAEKPSQILGQGTTGSSTQMFDAINGSKITEALASLRPLAVMVENHPDVWPQSGLSSADIVYETLAEGGITRFLALYQSQETEIIGPVRSAREYFAALADEWGALYAHVGGSNEVIAQINRGDYKNLDDANEYYNFEFFPRRPEKPEPHHIFTSTKKLQDLIEHHQFFKTANFQPWLFKEDRPTATTTASKISIDFSRPGYETGWEYEPATNFYKRLQYFQPHIDENTGLQILAKNIVVQIVKVTPVPKDPLLQVDIDLETGGRAIVFQDGIFIDGSWKKQKGRTRFFDQFKNEIEFNRGPIWLELVPEDKEASLVWK